MHPTITPRDQHFMFQFFPEGLDDAKCNDFYEISNLMQDSLNSVGSAPSPICEVHNIAANKGVSHFIRDPALYKLFGRYHRYGPSPEDLGNQHSCPFKAGPLRDRITKIFPKPNMLTFYQGENSQVRRAIYGFLNNKNNLKALEVVWEAIAKDWTAEMMHSKEVKLFSAARQLISRYLIEGILGYPCRHDDVLLNANFWQKLLWPLPSELHSLSEIIDGKTSLLSDGWEVAKKFKLFLWDHPSIQQLVEHIMAFGNSAEGRQRPSLCTHLIDELQDQDLVEGSIALMLIAGQETLSTFLGYLLYEYAKQPERADCHARELIAKQQLTLDETSFLDLAKSTPCYQMFLETLRAYPTGGSPRQAGIDMIVRYLSSDDTGCEHYIRKDEIIACDPFFMGHNASIWPDPEKFDPERDNLKDVKRKVLPFGTGVHSCPGEKATAHQIMTTLAVLLPRASITTVDELPPLINTTVIQPIDDITVRFDDRP